MQKSHETIDRLFRSHHRDLITRARRVIGSGDAEDLVQEAYLKMLESDRGELISNARGYVSKMTCTLAIDNLRRQRTHARALAEDGAWFQSPARDTQITTALDAFGLARDVQAALARLPRCCRQIFLMSRILGFSHSEIAQELGVSLKTINRNLGRALEHFDRAFEIAPSSVPIEFAAASSRRPRQATPWSKLPRRDFDMRQTSKSRRLEKILAPSCPIFAASLVIPFGFRVLRSPSGHLQTNPKRKPS